VPILFFLLTILTAIRSWVVRPYFRDPEPRPLRDLYLWTEEEFTKHKLIAQFISAYEWNAAVMKKKVRELRWSTWYFLSEIVSLTMGLPFLRTSVDHGTAFPIAGQNKASEISMVEALKAAATYYW